MFHDFLINKEVSLAGGQSLTLEAQRLRNDVDVLSNRLSNMTIFNTLKALDLPETATLGTIGRRMPRWSMLVLNVYSASHGKTMPLPDISGGANPAPMSGILIAYRMDDHKKVYFEWRNEHLSAKCQLNEHVSANVTAWTFDYRPNLNIQNAGAGYWGGKMSNIWVAGTYYFTKAMVDGFTDKPVSGGGFLRVMNAGNTKGSDRNYEYTLNTVQQHKWVRQNDGPWQNVPVCFPAGATDNALRVGDMKIAGNGRLHIRLSDSIVGQITYTGEK